MKGRGRNLHAKLIHVRPAYLCDLASQQHRTLLGQYRRQLPPPPPYFVRFSFDDAAYSLLALLLVRIVEVERKLRDIGVGFQFDLVPLY